MSLKLDPNGIDAHVILAEAFLALGTRFAKTARDHARTATRINPHHWHAYTQLARAHLVTSLSRRPARKAAQMAIRLAPQEPFPYLVLGDVEQHYDKPWVAKKLYRKALSLDPTGLSAPGTAAALAMPTLASLRPAQFAQSTIAQAASLGQNPGDSAAQQALDMSHLRLLNIAMDWVFLNIGLVYDFKGAFRIPLAAIGLFGALYAAVYVFRLSATTRRRLRKRLSSPRLAIAVLTAVAALVLIEVSALPVFDAHYKKMQLTAATLIWTARLIVINRMLRLLNTQPTPPSCAAMSGSLALAVTCFFLIFTLHMEPNPSGATTKDFIIGTIGVVASLVWIFQLIKRFRWRSYQRKLIHG